MRTILFSLLMTLTSAAMAQENEEAWLVEEQVSIRFAEGDTQGPLFDEGIKVVVVYREGDRVRVKGDAGFGWVPEASITSVRPAASDLDIEAMMERIKAMNLGAGGATSSPFTVGGGQ